MGRLNKCIRKLLSLLQHGKQIQQASPAHQRPSLKTPEEWRTYWQKRDQPWRTKPEIDAKRQEYLARCRLRTPNFEQGIYPFKDVEPKLTRADIEWLLATHESGGICGPVDLSDERQREREGLDLRGAHLEGEDLRGLPLARIRGGLTREEQTRSTDKQREMAAVHLQKAELWEANLQEADLVGANLQEAVLWGANLQEAYLVLANLQKADLWEANLQEAYLVDANLQEADLKRTQLKGAHLERMVLGNEKQVGPRLVDCQWGEVNLAVIKWSQVKILGDEYIARQKKGSEGETKEKWWRLFEYEGAVRANRQLAIILRNQGLNEVADRFAYRAQVLQKSVLWYQMTQQGVAFRQRMQALGGWLFSWFLFLLAGYGYRLRRTLGWYIAVNIFCGLLYFLGEPHGVYFVCPSSLEQSLPHILGACYWNWGTILPTALDALATSITALHGRGLFSMPFGPGNWRIYLAAGEAVIGLFIEATLIATFIQRFFGK